jgi:hypothetical protein
MYLNIFSLRVIAKGSLRKARRKRGRVCEDTVSKVLGPAYYEMVMDKLKMEEYSVVPSILPALWQPPEQLDTGLLASGRSNSWPRLAETMWNTPSPGCGPGRADAWGGGQSCRLLPAEISNSNTLRCPQLQYPVALVKYFGITLASRAFELLFPQAHGLVSHVRFCSTARWNSE